VLEEIRFVDDSFITLAAGSTFEFDENTGLVVHKARFHAAGEEAKPVTLTGAREVPGYWKGVIIQGSDSIDNAIEHAVISYAGASKNYGGVKPAALMFDNNYGKSTYKVHNTELSHSAGYGLYAEHNIELDFANNTLIKNKEGAAWVQPEILGQLDAESSYAGNEKDVVAVGGEKLRKVEATWPAIDVPYHVTKDLRVEDDSFVTIEPGAYFKFDENTGLLVHKGKLMAKGTAERPIKFSGAREAKGFWKGISVRGSSSIDNILENVVVEHAGSSKNFGGVQPAGVMFDSNYGQVSYRLKNLLVRDSAAGVYIEKNVELLSDDCGGIKLETEPKETEKSQKFAAVCKK
jgi:hypothetical protein